jgi:hypothetical protein
MSEPEQTPRQWNYEALAEEFRQISCGGDMLGATWHQLRIYAALKDAATFYWAALEDGGVNLDDHN